MSIVVTRSYNSLNASQDGEFGYGWNLGLSDTSLDVRHVDGAVQTSFGGDNIPFRDGTRVIITLPDGKREGFTFYGEPGNQALGIVTDWKAKFLPDYGVTSQIIVPHRTLQRCPFGGGQVSTLMRAKNASTSTSINGTLLLAVSRSGWRFRR